MGEDSDAEAIELVEAARRGDEAAWECLYRALYPRLRGYLARRVGREHAEDAVSETMARAIAGIERFRWEPAGFDGWVFGIARRVAADHHRTTARRDRHARAGQMVMAADLDGDGSPGDAMLVAEDHVRLRRAFSRLSRSEQELLELRVVAGLSAEKVAAVLGKRAGAVRTAQSRVLTRLRVLMESDDG